MEGIERGRQRDQRRNCVLEWRYSETAAAGWADQATGGCDEGVGRDEGELRGWAENGA